MLYSMLLNYFLQIRSYKEGINNEQSVFTGIYFRESIQDTAKSTVCCNRSSYVSLSNIFIQFLH